MCRRMLGTTSIIWAAEYNSNEYHGTSTMTCSIANINDAHERTHVIWCGLSSGIHRQMVGSSVLWSRYTSTADDFAIRRSVVRPKACRQYRCIADDRRQVRPFACDIDEISKLSAAGTDIVSEEMSTGAEAGRSRAHGRRRGRRMPAPPISSMAAHSRLMLEAAPAASRAIALRQ